MNQFFKNKFKKLIKEMNQNLPKIISLEIIYIIGNNISFISIIIRYKYIFYTYVYIFYIMIIKKIVLRWLKKKFIQVYQLTIAAI